MVKSIGPKVHVPPYFRVYSGDLGLLGLRIELVLDGAGGQLRL